MKKFSDSYLYQKADYGKEIFNYLMEAEKVDKQSDGFNDILYDVKRQATTPAIIKVLLSNKIELLIDKKGMSHAFKVLYAKDIRNNKKDEHKVYIDCTGIISHDNGVYRCTKIGTLISYLITAMTYVIYYNDKASKSILSNVALIQSGSEAFVDMMLYVLGYLKVPVTYSDNKERMSFVLSEYFQYCIVGRDNSDGVYNVAKKVSGIKEAKTCDYLHTLFNTTFDEGHCDIKKFIAEFARVFMGQEDGVPMPKNRTPLTVDVFIQRWMYAYGPSTYLALELFVPFSQMITDCYIGAFLNQQNTIEKVAGKSIITFSNELLKIGSENA